MKPFTILFTLLFFTAYSNAQLFSIDQHGLSLYESGSELIKSGDYKKAETLLTEALCTYKNENVFYNRAVARLLLTDTSGFCEDMFIAGYKYFDNDAAKTFNEICCDKVDTLYYDKKRNLKTSSKYRYYEIIKDVKYKELIFGSYHDVKFHDMLYSADFGCDDDILGVATKPTDIIADYQIKQGIKYYHKTTKPVSINNSVKYEYFKERATNLLNAKYKKIKSDHKIENIEAFFKLYITDNGEINKIEFLKTIPEIVDEEFNNEIEKDVLDILKEYPRINPARFFNDKVNFIALDKIIF